MAEHQIDAVESQQAAAQEYVRSAAGSSGAADQLTSLADLPHAGKLSDEEYAAAKRGVLGS